MNMQETHVWWESHLGAQADPTGSWQWSSHPGYDHFSTPGSFQTLLLTSFGSTLEAELFLPRNGHNGRVVIVPFYDAPSVFGAISPRTARTGRVPRNPLGSGLAKLGLGVLAVPWWFEVQAGQSQLTSTAQSLDGRYGPPAKDHAQHFPDRTALGRSIGDLRLAARALLADKVTTPGHLGAFGHSLGGKLSLHLGALEPAIDAVATHEPGVGFKYSNWDAPWYLGERIPADRDQNEIIGLVAPRPLLVSGGGASDGGHNRHLTEESSHLWNDQGPELLIHNNGHPVPAHVLVACCSWLADHLS